MRVLVVDDDRTVADLLSRKLKQEHFVVDIAYDGDEAFFRAQKDEYDVIVLDIMLPKRSGFDIIRGLRTLGIGTPILAISALGSVEDRVMGLDMGADDYLVKNFSLSEFIARVKSLMRRKTAISRNILHYKDILVDFSSMTVRQRGQIVSLTRKEFGLLTELLRHKNTTLSREELLDLLWPTSKEKPASNTIDAHIKMLRKKFGRSLSIESVRGVGYLLRDDSSTKNDH